MYENVVYFKITFMPPHPTSLISDATLSLLSPNPSQTIDINIYNPPINLGAILLVTLRHVVQNHRTVITQ